ncbi:hypothetical protein [Xanthomonas arboricola]|uniref:Uncharacterized protein n=3 Tax=Xanthomonas arboricola pv. pruni TaxID=69929 RepID=A0AAQ0W500_9XANT|nr:hypothetical protein [Xanthomonas arboricola]KCW98999.1 hypothetical protein DK27_04545 [Xanthomonas arboricola pv. pruni]KPN11187.1 hypothetical protein AN652_07485 [Xanthomonas arboricola pv. pruni]MDN0266404.1 hypothetical protein [Xanthomonas arboricola pv. pruni]MDN0270568.1 hypothetical protein [Xanthomonas arboricola pv. pruni]MDN0274860.1 hypothetical protein [Xanthomonas arboricola pv. pruni]
MSTAQPARGTMLSRPLSGWVRWGIPALWLGWVALYVAGSLLRDGVPQQLEVLRWLAPALVVLMTLRLAWASARLAQVRDAGDALEIKQQGRSQRVDLAELRSVDAASLIPPRRMALKFHGTRADVVFLPAHGQKHDQLATTLLARASARRGVEKATT